MNDFILKMQFSDLTFSVNFKLRKTGRPKTYALINSKVQHPPSPGNPPSI